MGPQRGHDLMHQGKLKEIQVRVLEISLLIISPEGSGGLLRKGV